MLYLNEATLLSNDAWCGYFYEWIVPPRGGKIHLSLPSEGEPFTGILPMPWNWAQIERLNVPNEFYIEQKNTTKKKLKREQSCVELCENSNHT